MKIHKKLILGSTSPRRKEIFEYFNVPFVQVSPNFDETQVPFNGSPSEFVMEAAKGKAKMIQKKYPTECILSADTIVFFENEILGKPISYNQAFSFLQRMQGKKHSVYTGIALACNGEIEKDFAVTHVLFNTLSDDKIKKYLEHVTWQDKAGAYAIQNSGALLVKNIEGCFYNVVGLPINAVQTLLSKKGIELWDFL